MRNIATLPLLLLALLLLRAPATLCAEEEDPAADVADVPGERVTLGNDEHKQYFRIGPKGTEEAGDEPEKGYGLLVILPGGSGSADFHAFCKRIFKQGCPDGYVAAQPVAVRWTDDQEVVWPTKDSGVEGMEFSTEEFVEEVIADVARWKKIDRERIFVLAWSSSGPAAYALSLTSRSSPTGYFIAMSVFKPDSLPSLRNARGKAYFLYHSPDDKVCPYRMAKDAEHQLDRKGAKVEFRDYAGGHGWRGPLYRDIADGIAWLERNHGRPPRKG